MTAQENKDILLFVEYQRSTRMGKTDHVQPEFASQYALIYIDAATKNRPCNRHDNAMPGHNTNVLRPMCTRTDDSVARRWQRTHQHGDGDDTR